MALRVWLHESVGPEPGWKAWALDFLGFGTWAPTEDELVERVPAKLEEYLRWLDRHGLSQSSFGGAVEIVERAVGDEIMFSPDREAASTSEIERTRQLLEVTRGDLLDTVEPLSDDVLDWDPPYRDFGDWADWRTVRQVLAHIANTETYYYLRHIGYEPAIPPAPPDGDWRSFMSPHRDEVLAFLDRLEHSHDRARVKEDEHGQWSVRKSLRRLVRHELLHWKSIQRIIREYRTAC